jgi:hypothetical protein
MAANSVPSPATLMQAHELLGRMRPRLGASRQTWLVYYRRSAAMYAEVAEIDRGHHHEAMYWASRERAKANKLAVAIGKDPTAPMTPEHRGEVEEPPASL